MVCTWTENRINFITNITMTTFAVDRPNSLTTFSGIDGHLSTKYYVSLWLFPFLVFVCLWNSTGDRRHQTDITNLSLTSFACRQTTIYSNVPEVNQNTSELVIAKLTEMETLYASLSRFDIIWTSRRLRLCEAVFRSLRWLNILNRISSLNYHQRQWRQTGKSI